MGREEWREAFEVAEPWYGDAYLSVGHRLTLSSALVPDDPDAPGGDVSLLG